MSSPAESVQSALEADWDYTLITYADPNINEKPLYATGFGSRILDIDGDKIQAHETNNLWSNILDAKKLREELKINPQAPILARRYDYYFRRNALEIFSKFEDEYPDLHQRILELTQQLLAPGEKNLELLTERDIYLSMAFERLSIIALDQDPVFGVHSLTV